MSQKNTVTDLGEAMSTLIQVAVEEQTRESGAARTGAPAWYAIHTWPRYEKKVAEGLLCKDLNVFLPLHSAQHQWSDRRRLIQSPLFPGYVFVRILETAATRSSILQTAGVAGFVGVRGAGIAIPDTEIDAVHAILKKGIPFSSHPFVNVGKRIRLRGGSLDGIEGILTAIDGNDTLVVSVELISRSLAIRVAGYRVEPV